MNIKDLSKKSLDFTIKRVAEIIGLFLIFISILFFVALSSYSPEDPNFIFTKNEDIKNILGFRGSYISDLFFQSIGLISFLISFTIFFTGINLIRNKNYLILIENTFYLILYSILGSVFFTILLVSSNTLAQSIRERTYWNMQNVRAQNPFELGLCNKEEIEKVIDKYRKDN